MSRTSVMLTVRFRSMTRTRRREEIVRLLTQPFPETVTLETLDYRARLVTALREEGLWPDPRQEVSL